MSSNHNGKEMKPTPNAPNPAKFLKEIQALVPQLKAKGIIPLSREEARAQGERSTTAAAMKAEKESQRRLEITGRMIDEYMKALSPWSFRLAEKYGWTWIFKLIGYRYRVEPTKETIDLCPNIACTRVYVLRRIWPFPEYIVRAERLVWEQPKPPKPPKSRIIMP